MDFGWAVFTSYFIGMPVALILYRIFVFHGQEGSVGRQFTRFLSDLFWLLAPDLAFVDGL